eukprot:jgi/Bigna1/67290/fgenesh1_pg.3_\
MSDFMGGTPCQLLPLLLLLLPLVVVRSRKAQESEGRAGLAYLYPSFGVVAIVVLFVGVTSFRIKGEAASSNLCGLMPVPIPPEGYYLLGVPMKDYGMPCERGSDCSSGLCGVSCSALNWAPDNATSCICPISSSSSSSNSTATNAYEKRCCGCITNSQDRIHTCPDYPDFVRVEGGGDHELPQLNQRPYDCGWWGNFEWNDDVFEEPDLPYVKTWHVSNNDNNDNNNNIENSFGELHPDASSGTKRFGERCGDHSECQSGMSKTIILPPVPPPSSPLFKLSNPPAQTCAQHGNCTSMASFPYPPRSGYPRPKYAFEYAYSEDEYWRTRPITCADGVQSRCNVDLHCVT